MNKSLALILLIFLSTLSFSQNYIKGLVTDSTKAPVSFCAMALMNAKDSTQVKGNLSDSSGLFVFEKVKPGNYFIKFADVGYKSLNTATFTVDSASQIILPNQILKAEGVNLNEVSVAVYKPAIEFKKGDFLLIQF